MALPEGLFWVCAAALGIGVILSLSSRTAGAAARGYGLLAAGLVGCAGLLHAPLLGLMQLLAAVLVLVCMWQLADDRAGPRSRVVAKVAFAGGLAFSLGAVAFVLVGALARQYISYGAELGVASSYGGAAPVAELLLTRGLLAWPAAGMILLAAVLTLVPAGGGSRTR